MAAVIGNVALLLDVSSHRTVITDRRIRLAVVDVVLNLQKRDPHGYVSSHYASLSSNKPLESDGQARRRRRLTRGKAKSRANAVDYDEAGSSDEGDGKETDEEEDEEAYDAEKEMKRRAKELQDMRELERKAEELQYKIDEEGGDDDSEEKKRMRVKRELEKVAQEQAERRATAELMFELGQKAYGKGMYGRAIEFLEGALTIIPRPTLFGGEIQIWLAMAYEANNRHADCIDLYQQLEKRHPSPGIRRQASELRYILQAPKLKISQEEMVTIPMIGSSYDSYAVTWSDKERDKDRRMNESTTNQLDSSEDFLGKLLVWRPPVGMEKNKVFWLSLTLWFGLVGAALLLQR
ncbi:Orf03 protein [Hirschfeldia incana]|nr:Orf03 protein [Hirschfeldia incana]